MENQEIKSEDKILSIVCQLSFFIAGIGTVLVPLVVWLFKKDESPWLAANAKQAMVYQVAGLVLGTVLGTANVVLGMVTLGLGSIVLLPLTALIGLAFLIPPILASIANWNGQPYRYPVVGQLADKF